MGLNKYQNLILPVQLLLSIKNQFFIFKIPLQIYQIILISLFLWDIFSVFLRQLRTTFLNKIMMIEKNNLSSNA